MWRSRKGSDVVGVTARWSGEVRDGDVHGTTPFGRATMGTLPVGRRWTPG